MVLSGRTSVLPLFDVVQMLSVNESTGMLKVETKNEKGYLYFQDGTVINALDGEHRDGEEAAKSVFALEDADFSFAPELPSVAQRIRCSTQNLMMEIARQLDEDSADGDGSGPKHGERLREAQLASQALREIFQQLDEESKILTLRTHQGMAMADLLGGVRDTPGAVLHIRRGMVPMMRSGDRMLPVGEIVLDGAGYEEVRDLLLRNAIPLGPVGGAADAYLLTAGSHGRFRVERLNWEGGDLMTVRAAPEVADLAAGLPWPPDRLDALLALPAAVVLVTAPDRTSLGRAFESACAHLLSRELGPVLGLARRWTAPSPRAATVLLSTLRPGESAAAVPLVDRLEPALVAVEDSDCRPALAAALRALRGGGRALIGVCAPTPAHVAHRFLEGMPSEKRRLWAYHLGAGLGAVLAAGGGCFPVDDDVRAALIGGDVSALVAALTPGEDE